MNLWCLVGKKEKKTSPSLPHCASYHRPRWTQVKRGGNKELEVLGETDCNYTQRRENETEKKNQQTERKCTFSCVLSAKIKASTFPWDRWHRWAVTFDFRRTIKMQSFSLRGLR